MLLILCLTVLPLLAQSQARIVQPIVDLRVELLGIVYRLVGNEEYNSDDNRWYVQRIHEHFDRFKDHALIRYAQQFRDTLGIGYDAVTAMAVHIEPPPALTPIVPFARSVPESRWDAVTPQNLCSCCSNSIRMQTVLHFFGLMQVTMAAQKGSLPHCLKKWMLTGITVFMVSRPPSSFIQL
jgi:ATP adenylyltransferase/5',5'''-P-1,P-4-tetraphosphate phosphorylase II